MLNINYLQNLLSAANGGLAAVTNPTEQVIDSPDIQEGLIEVTQHKGLPFAVLFEEAYRYDDDNSNDVPQTRYSQSIYVLRMVSGNGVRRTEETECFNDVLRIRALLLAHSHDEEVMGWDRRPRRDFVSGGPNYVGWKITVSFVDSESWVLEPLSE